MFQSRAEPWEQTQIRRIWCLFFCAFAFEVEGIHVLRDERGSRSPCARASTWACRSTSSATSSSRSRSASVRTRHRRISIVCRAGPVQGPSGLRDRRVRQEEAEQARAEGRARPASLNHLTRFDQRAIILLRRRSTNVPLRHRRDVSHAARDRGRDRGRALTRRN